MRTNKKLFKIYFHGSLAAAYGEVAMEVYAGNVQEAFKGLTGRFGNKFKHTILNGSWHITKGRRYTKHLLPEDDYMTEPEVILPCNEEELHIFPAIVGAGGRGIGQIILGVVLIIVAVVLVVTGVGAPAGAGIIAGLTGGGLATSLAVAGVLAIASGIITMLSKPPSMGDYSSTQVDQRQSFIFNGAVNNTEQGVPVPLVYGEHLTGSTVISAGLDVEQL